MFLEVKASCLSYAEFHSTLKVNPNSMCEALANAVAYAWGASGTPQASLRGLKFPGRIMVAQSSCIGARDQHDAVQPCQPSCRRARIRKFYCNSFTRVAGKSALKTPLLTLTRHNKCTRQLKLKGRPKGRRESAFPFLSLHHSPSLRTPAYLRYVVC